ncbi:acyl-CoA thioesterase, partial [Rhizobium johnstonii]|uniref:acyl-CoA thioesterase n=1 Tax=Rhizobium johnstonii TaxID=3019933 RepID=UPI003F999B3B
AGGIHFYRPIKIGNIVEIDARLIHTSERSMHISIRVRSGSPSTPRELELTTQCLTVFIEKGPDGKAQPIRQMPLLTDEDRRLDAHARELIELRGSMAV